MFDALVVNDDLYVTDCVWLDPVPPFAAYVTVYVFAVQVGVAVVAPDTV